MRIGNNRSKSRVARTWKAGNHNRGGGGKTRPARQSCFGASRDWAMK